MGGEGIMSLGKCRGWRLGGVGGEGILGKGGGMV